MSIIFTLWKRQVIRFLRSKVRIVGAMGQPMLFFLALGFGFGPVYQRAGMGNYIQFLAPGIIGMTTLFAAMFSGIELIYDRQFGFLKATLVAPVPRALIVLGRTLGSATVAMIQGLIVFVICLIAGFRPTNWWMMPLALLFMALIAVLFTSLATAVASSITDFQGFQLVVNFLAMPLFFLSGALFPLNVAPAALKLVASFDPLSYGVDGLRISMVGMAHYTVNQDLWVLAAVTILFLLAGTRRFRMIQL